MEYSTCEIISLKKKEIVYKNVKHRKYRLLTLLILAFIVPAVVVGFIGFDRTNKYLETIAKLGNPIYSPYDSYDGIIFTNADAYLLKDCTALNLPVVTNTINKTENGLKFLVQDNLTLSAPESGVITEITINNDGSKNIKILHSKSCVSVIKNINILGVNNLNYVLNDQKIGTLKNGVEVEFELLIDGVRQDLEVLNNKIVWKN
mgnify:FL=1